MKRDRATSHPATDDSIRRIAAGFRTAMRLTGLSHRACERELRLPAGSLTRILDGKAYLHVSLILNLCRMLELPPAAFFTALFPFPELFPDSTARLLHGIGAVHIQSDSTTTLPKSIEEVLLHLRGAVQGLKAYLAKSKRTEAP